MSKYSEFGKRMERHNNVEFESSTFGQMTFSIPERSFDTLRFISARLDEYDLSVSTVLEREDKIQFTVVFE
jgi:hypothetical protein